MKAALPWEGNITGRKIEVFLPILKKKLPIYFHINSHFKTQDLFSLYHQDGLQHTRNYCELLKITVNLETKSLNANTTE